MRKSIITERIVGQKGGGPGEERGAARSEEEDEGGGGGDFYARDHHRCPCNFFYSF